MTFKRNLIKNCSLCLLGGLSWVGLTNFYSYKQEKEDLMKISEKSREISAENSIELYENFSLKNKICAYGIYLVAKEIKDKYKIQGEIK